MAMLAEELFAALVGVLVVVTDDGPELGEVIVEGALKTNVYDPVSGASVALKRV